MECIGCDAEACGVDFSDDEDEAGPRSPGAHGEHGSPSSSRKGLLSVDGKYDNYTASFRHVVMFTFKETATEEERTVAKQALAALPGVVHNKRGEPIIRNFSFGNDLQNQPSNFDFAIVADFAAPEDYQLYRVHRDHQKLSKAMLEPIIDKRAAVQIPLVPAGITIQVRRGMLRHVVLFKWRGDVTDEQLMALRHGLSLLPEEIPQVVNFFFGDNTNSAVDFDFCIVADFDNYKDYQIYGTHPAHKSISASVLAPMVQERAGVQFLL